MVRPPRKNKNEAKIYCKNQTIAVASCVQQLVHHGTKNCDTSSPDATCFESYTDIWTKNCNENMAGTCHCMSSERTRRTYQSINDAQRLHENDTQKNLQSFCYMERTSKNNDICTSYGVTNEISN